MRSGSGPCDYPGKSMRQQKQQVQRPKGRIVLEGCEQDGDVEGPDSRPHGHGQKFGNFLSVMRILWNASEQ